jgi:hypothetical protein
VREAGTRRPRGRRTGTVPSASHQWRSTAPPRRCLRSWPRGRTPRDGAPGVQDIQHVSGQATGAVYRQGVSGPGGRRIPADYLVPRPESFALFDGCRLSSRRGRSPIQSHPARRATTALYRQLGMVPRLHRLESYGSAQGRGARRRCRRRRSGVRWLRPCRPPHHLT